MALQDPTRKETPSTRTPLQWMFKASLCLLSPPPSPSFQTFNYFLLENSLRGLGTIKMISSNCDERAILWFPHIMAKQLYASLGKLWYIFQKVGPFFMSGALHAGCNGNPGSLLLEKALQFSFGDSPREGLPVYLLGRRIPPSDTEPPSTAWPIRCYGHLRDSHMAKLGQQETGLLLLW